MADTVRVKIMKPKASGRRTGWNKLVTKVNDTKSNGYAFEGSFLDERQIDLEVGSVLVGQIPVGSAKSGKHWRAGIIGSSDVEWEERTWPLEDFLDFKDYVKALLQGTHNEEDVAALQEEKEGLLERVRQIDLLLERTGGKGD